MEKFLESIHDLFTDNYFTFFENEDVDGSGPWMVSDIVFGFTYIKLLDCALKYSKDYVLNAESDESLMDIATYPDGEALGFYNASEYDLERLCESGVDIRTKLDNYLGGFSNNVKAVLDELEFSDVLDFLDRIGMTYNVLCTFNDSEITGDYCSSYAKFMDMFSEFIRSIWDDEIYSIGREPIANYDASSSYHYIHEALKEYGSFLNALLLIDGKFENNEDVKIYDPDSSGTYILDEAKEMVSMFKTSSGHPDAKVELYGKSKKMENKTVYLAKRSVSKKDPYEIEGATILDVSKDIFSVEGIDKYSDFDLIVSNYLYNGLTEYKDILEAFKHEADGNTKLVISLENLEDFIGDLAEIVSKDNLEAIISFKNHYIVIANLDKSEQKKGHFLLINEYDGDLDDERVDKDNRQAFSNNDYDIINAPFWKTLTESDRRKMKTIGESYFKFEDSIDSRVMENDDFDKEMIEILLN